MTYDEICLLNDDVVFTNNKWEKENRKFYFEAQILYQENEYGFAVPYCATVEDTLDTTWHKV